MTFICVLKLYGIVNILKQTAESDQEANKVYFIKRELNLMIVVSTPF